MAGRFAGYDWQAHTGSMEAISGLARCMPSCRSSKGCRRHLLLCSNCCPDSPGAYTQMHLISNAFFLLQIDLLKSKLKFDAAFNYKTTDDWSKKLKEVAPGKRNPCTLLQPDLPCENQCAMDGLTAADGVNIYFENVGGGVSTASDLSVSQTPSRPPLQCRCWWVLPPRDHSELLLSADDGGCSQQHGDRRLYHCVWHDFRLQHTWRPCEQPCSGAHQWRWPW